MSWQLTGIEHAYVCELMSQHGAPEPMVPVARYPLATPESPGDTHVALYAASDEQLLGLVLNGEGTGTGWISYERSDDTWRSQYGDESPQASLCEEYDREWMMVARLAWHQHRLLTIARDEQRARALLSGVRRLWLDDVAEAQDHAQARRLGRELAAEFGGTEAEFDAMLRAAFAEEPSA